MNLILVPTSLDRSKAQLLVDTVEDNMDEQLSLDLSGIGARHITNRIYDFSPLTSLNISGNRLRKLPDDIQYLARYTLTCILNFLSFSCEYFFLSTLTAVA